MRKYPIDSNGDVGSVSWDAGNLLQSATAASRTIKTLKAGVLTSFDTTNIVFGDLGVTTDTERNDIVGYVRGETASNKDNWKLGDIFRSTPVTIGTPSVYFKDNRDANAAFDTYRSSNVRSTANG